MVGTTLQPFIDKVVVLAFAVMMTAMVVFIFLQHYFVVGAVLIFTGVLSLATFQLLRDRPKWEDRQMAVVIGILGAVLIIVAAPLAFLTATIG